MVVVNYKAVAHDGSSTDSYEGDGDISFSSLHDKRPDPLLLLNNASMSRRRQPTDGLKCRLCVGFSLVCATIAFIVIILASMEVFSGGHSSSKENSPAADKPVVEQDRLTTKSHWEIVLNFTGSESALRVFDMNSDGVLDVVFGTVQRPGLTGGYCDEFTDGCTGAIQAIDGRDGSLLWRIPTKNEVFEMTCPAFDVDGDQSVDCIGSGRYGTITAFNPRTGEALWRADDAINSMWSVFGPAVVDDLDNDNIPDLVIVNGGDQKYQPEDLERGENWILLLSGADGTVMGRPFPTPDGQESYSLPIVYPWADGSKYILFGTGGETVAGGFYAISLRDLYLYIMESDVNTFTGPGSYNYWDTSDFGENGVITLHKSAPDGKGSILPPALVDLNHDLLPEIVLLAFDGSMTVFNGYNLQPLWTLAPSKNDNMSLETYCAPAFAHFNDDDTLDIMTTWFHGSWPAYDSMLVFINDGIDGSLLWYAQSPSLMYAGASPLVAMTTVAQRDAFLFHMSSIDEPFANVMMGTRGRRSASRTKKHIGVHKGAELSCSHIETVYVDTFLMDRTLRSTPLHIYRQNALKYEYEITEELRNKSDAQLKLHGLLADELADTRSRRHAGEDDIFCSRLVPRDASTGVLTDVDGDGFLDYLSVHVLLAPIIDEFNQTLETFIQTRIVLQALEKSLTQYPQKKLPKAVYSIMNTDTELSLNQLRMKPVDQQRWSQLYGPLGDGRMPNPLK